MSENSARSFICVACHCLVQICCSCDRGNIYCSSTCSNLSRKKLKKDANKRYQSGRKGRTNHAKRQQRYRLKKNKVTGHSIQKTSVYVSLSIQEKKQVAHPIYVVTEKFYCCICGKLCSKFVRKNFLLRTVANKKKIVPLQPQAP